MTPVLTPSGEEDDSVSTSVAADLLGVTADAVVKMIDAGTLDAERTGEGKGRYRIPRSQVEEERGARLGRLHAVDATGAEPELRQRIAELERQAERLGLEAARLTAAVRSLTGSNRAALDAVDRLTSASLTDDSRAEGPADDA